MAPSKRMRNQIGGVALGCGLITTVVGGVVIESRYHDINHDDHFQPLELYVEPHIHSEVLPSGINLTSTGYVDVATPGLALSNMENRKIKFAIDRGDNDVEIVLIKPLPISHNYKFTKKQGLNQSDWR